MSGCEFNQALDSNGKPVVVLVHGTFAADENDRGDKWWQYGSDFREELSARLGDEFAADEHSPIFHWTGQNTFNDRKWASIILRDLIHTLEGKEIDYHLVGHSHGGSVILGALALDAFERSVSESTNQAKVPIPKSLLHLKSWTTVGTPFISTKNADALGLIRGLALNACLSVLSFIFFILSAFLAALFFSEKSYSFGIIFLAASFIFIFWGIYLNKSFRTYWRLPNIRRLDQVAAEIYTKYWLGISSDEDEAINGLRLALEMSVPVLPRKIATPTVKGLDKVHYHWQDMISCAIYNKFLRPIANRMLIRRFRRSAYGNDQIRLKVEDVHMIPPYMKVVIPDMPKSIACDLTDQANESMAKIIPSLRSQIGVASGVDGSVFQFLANDEMKDDYLKSLIHTSYLSHSGIIDIISARIRYAQYGDSGLNHMNLPDEYGTFLKLFDDAVNT